MLRGIDLHGFKTFAARTHFEFQGGVTAVIGPNGSGKSNLADAVRWVLAEPAGRGLRVRRSEDLLFAGGSGRHPAGMAEVGLRLDNSQGFLPIHFSEVVVTRRLHRSGESEFLINGSRSRQRDVLELLARAGLAQSTYAVIGQGLIDAALSLRPEERRELIEEAADVRRHQASLDESRTKLAATAANLQRVDDLVTELRPRVERLGKHAVEAAEHRRLAEELAGLLALSHRASWDAAVAAVATAQAAAKDAEAGLSAARNLVRELGERLIRVRNKSAEARTRHDRVLAAMRDAEAAADRARQESSYAARTAARIMEDVRRITTDLHDHRARAAADEKALAEASEVFDRVRSEIFDLNQVVTTKRTSATALDQTAASARAALSKTRRDLAMAEAEARAAEVLSDRLSAELASLTSTQAQPVPADLPALDLELRNAQQALSEHEQIRESIRAQRDELEQQITLVESRRSTLQIEMAGVRARLQEAERRLATLERAEGSGDGLQPAVRAILDRAGRLPALSPAGRGGNGTVAALERLSGIIGTVAELIDIPQGFEVAIEAALGGRAQDIVVEHWADAEKGIAYLRQIAAGRATFLPIDTVREARRNPPPAATGVHGLASEIARVEDRYRPILDRLLGNIVVVEDLQVARRCLREGSRGHQYVTLQGDTVGGWGSVSGGSRTTRQDSIWRRRAEKSGLERERETLLTRQSSLRAEHETLSGRLPLLRDDLRRLALELKAHDHSRSDHSNRVARADAQVERERAAAEERKRAESVRIVRQSDLQRQIAQVVVSSAAHQRTVESLRLAEREALSRSASADEAWVAAQGNANELANRLAGLEGTARSAEATSVRIREGILRERQLVARAETRLAELDKQRRESESAVAAHQSDSDAFSARADLLRREAEELVTVRQAMEDEERAVLAAEADARDRAAEQAEAAAAAERKSDSASTAIETLQRRLEADGLTPEDIERLDPPEDLDFDEVQRRSARLRARLRSMPSVSYAVIDEHLEEKARLDHLETELVDLRTSANNLGQAIDALEAMIADRFNATFSAVNVEFRGYFNRLFNGGSARLGIANNESDTSGIEIEAHPPGKKPQSLALLSGGERALTAAALIFALLKVNPIPFCVLDEVDAALDESNVRRFVDIVSELSAATQFVVITHNRLTVEAAPAVYGLGALPDGSTKVISLRLRE